VYVASGAGFGDRLTDIVEIERIQFDDAARTPATGLVTHDLRAWKDVV
jgi:hypothetical protein